MIYRQRPGAKVAQNPRESAAPVKWQFLFGRFRNVERVQALNVQGEHMAILRVERKLRVKTTSAMMGFLTIRKHGNHRHRV
jgi:hypothetical protein